MKASTIFFLTIPWTILSWLLATAILATVQLGNPTAAMVFGIPWAIISYWLLNACGFRSKDPREVALRARQIVATVKRLKEDTADQPLRFSELEDLTAKLSELDPTACELRDAIVASRKETGQ